MNDPRLAVLLLSSISLIISSGSSVTVNRLLPYPEFLSFGMKKAIVSEYKTGGNKESYVTTVLSLNVRCTSILKVSPLAWPKFCTIIFNEKDSDVAVTGDPSNDST